MENQFLMKMGWQPCQKGDIVVFIMMLKNPSIRAV